MPGTATAAPTNRGFFPIGGFIAEGEDGDKWLKIMPTGKWVYHHFPVEGNYEIGPKDVRAIADHFKAGLPGHQIAVDEGHVRGRAPGWIEELRADDEGLYARIDWTKFGEDLVADHQYGYFSPEWHGVENPYIDPKTGDKTPWVLVGLALTNNPFFEGELPVAASKDGSLIAAQPYSAPWDETDNQIRHRMRDSGDFRPDTFRTKNLSPSAVRKVEVSFDITSAMAGGVSMVMGKLKRDKVPEGGNPDSMVLQSLRWVRKTDEQDGWTLAQAKQWFSKSSFSKGEIPMPDPQDQDPKQPKTGEQDPASTGEDTIESLRAERDAALADKAKAEADKAQAEADLAAQQAATDAGKSQNTELAERVGSLEDKDARREIRDRLTALRFGEQKDRALSPSHIDKLVDAAMALPAEKRDEWLETVPDTIAGGIVPIGEIGTAAGSGQPAVSAAQSEMNRQLGVSDETYLKHQPTKS